MIKSNGTSWLAALLLAFSITASSAAWADAAPPDSINPEGHAVPSKGKLIAELMEDLDPKIKGPETTVRLYQDVDGMKLREYAINGHVFQIEVIPYGGRPYMLIDQDGNGLFESRYDSVRPHFVLPQWVLFRF